MASFGWCNHDPNPSNLRQAITGSLREAEVMAYVATIDILIDVETEAEAMDAVAETMRPLMKPFNSKSCLRDWMYFDNGGGFTDHLRQIGAMPSDFQMDNEWPWSID